MSKSRLIQAPGHRNSKEKKIYRLLLDVCFSHWHEIARGHNCLPAELSILQQDPVSLTDPRDQGTINPGEDAAGLALFEGP